MAAVEAWLLGGLVDGRFTRRRRSLKTLVYRWDVEHAIGIYSQLDRLLRRDGSRRSSTCTQAQEALRGPLVP